MEDKKISEMAELLCKGVKMLSYHCPECNVPLFKDGDRIFCPVCGRGAVFESELEKVISEENMKRDTEESEEVKAKLTEVTKPDVSAGTESMRKQDVKRDVPQEIRGSGTAEKPIDFALKSIHLTILKLCKKMEKEEEISPIEKEVKLVKDLIEAAERLLKMKNDFQ